MVSLTDAELRLIEACRTAVLATIADDGRPRLVPVCFALRTEPSPVLYTPLDEKPKATVDVRALARVRDIEARPEVRLLFHRWSEDWRELAWLRVGGTATLVGPSDEPAAHGWAVDALRERYPQYRLQQLERAPLIRVEIDESTAWSADPRDAR